MNQENENMSKAIANTYAKMLDKAKDLPAVKKIIADLVADQAIGIVAMADNIVTNRAIAVGALILSGFGILYTTAIDIGNSIEKKKIEKAMKEKQNKPFIEKIGDWFNGR